MDDAAPNALYLLLCLVLVVSSLVGMRLSAGRALRMALAWIAIFGVVVAIFAFRGEWAALGARLKGEVAGSAAPVVSGSTVRITKRDDGHFWVDGRINGKPVRFLVDSGATTTTVSPDIAAAAGLEPGMRGNLVSTANGDVFMPKATAGLIEIGSIQRSDQSVFINPNDGTSVLGLNFLSSLSSWGVQRDVLVLTP